MAIIFQRDYLIALVGMAAGGGLGLAIGAARRAALSAWDARATIPLLLAAAGGHLLLVGAVEPLRQVLFVLYALSLIGVVGFAAAGWGIWRLGGVLFPAGSIAGYFYFASLVHQADYVGLLVKLVELAAIVAVLVPLLRGEGRPRRIAA